MLVYDIENFMRYCDNKGLSVKTLKSYEQTLRMFSNYMTKEAKIKLTHKITAAHITEYIAYIKERGKYTVCCVEKSKCDNYPERRRDYAKPVSGVTINNYLRNMSAFFNWMVAEGDLKKSPIRREHYMKVQRKPQNYLTNAEFKKLLEVMDNSKFSEYRDYIISQLLLDTGMRVGECLATRIENVDIVRRVIFLPAEITKGKADRNVFFSDKMAKNLRRWMQYKDRYRESDFLFCTNEGKPLQVSNFETNVRKYAKRAGLKNVHPHIFRNNFAKRFLMSGGDIYTLSKILGHSSVTVTEAAYLDLDEDDLRAQYQKHSPLENLG